MMGLFDDFLGSQKWALMQQQQSCPYGQGYGFQFMAAQRRSHGFEPIDWPRILVNQFRAEELTRPLTICEKLLYKGALAALAEEQ